MKVLTIFPDSLTTPVGGLGIQFRNIYQRLKDRIDFDIVGYPDARMEGPNYVGVCHPIPALEHGSINTLLGHTVYLAEALRYPKPDLVHSYDWSTYFAGVYLARIHKVPLLLSMQLSSNALATAGIANCIDFNSIDGRWLHKTHVEMEWFGLTHADKIINVSNAYANYFPQFRDKTTVIPNGIDIRDWQPTAKVTLPGSRKYKVVYIGRFCEMKSFNELLDAQIPEDIDLIVVGSQSGGSTTCVEKLQSRLSTVDNIHYYGPAYDQDKVNLLHSADAVIMPSKHEPFGIVALEALASKSILISSRIDGLGDFLDDNNSIKCETSPEGISKGLHDFVALSSEEKERLIRNGLETCQKYNWDDIANQYYEVYKSFTEK